MNKALGHIKTMSILNSTKGHTLAVAVHGNMTLCDIGIIVWRKAALTTKPTGLEKNIRNLQR